MKLLLHNKLTTVVYSICISIIFICQNIIHKLKIIQMTKRGHEKCSLLFNCPRFACVIRVVERVLTDDIAFFANNCRHWV